MVRFFLRSVYIYILGVFTEKPYTKPLERNVYSLHSSNYAPNFEEVDGAYWFRVVCACYRASVRSSRTAHARVLKFHIWIPHGKIADARFFCPSYLPFWSYVPLKKSSYEPCMLGF